MWVRGSVDVQSNYVRVPGMMMKKAGKLNWDAIGTVDSSLDFAQGPI